MRRHRAPEDATGRDGRHGGWRVSSGAASPTPGNGALTSDARRARGQSGAGAGQGGGGGKREGGGGAGHPFLAPEGGAGGGGSRGGGPRGGGGSRGGAAGRGVSRTTATRWE